MGTEAAGHGDFRQELAACSRCRHCDRGDVQDDYGPRMMMLCSTCLLRGVHVECEEARTQRKLSKSAVVDSDTVWFCSEECRRVHENLERMVVDLGPVGNRTLELVGTSAQGRGVKMQQDAAQRILQGAFEPLIMDNGKDLIEMVIHKFETPDDEITDDDTGHDYSTFHTFVLKEGSTVVCAGTVRIFGTLMAELPFVGTKEGHRKQGVLRTFMACLEAILAELGVKQLVVAAATPLKRMWQRAFGFAPLTVEEAAAVEDTLVSPDPETCVMMRKALGAQAAREDTLTGALASARAAVASTLAKSAKRTAPAAAGPPGKRLKRSAAQQASTRIASAPDSDGENGSEAEFSAGGASSSSESDGDDSDLEAEAGSDLEAEPPQQPPQASTSKPPMAKAQKARGATTQAAAAQAAMGSASAPIDGAREQVPKGTRKGVNAAAAILRHRRLDLLAAMLSLRRDATRAVIVRGERAAASAQLSEAQADKRIADTCAALAAQAAQRTAEPAGTSPVAASPGGHHDDASTADAHSPKRAGPSGAGAPEDGTACAAHPASARISFPLQHHRPATSAAMAEAPVAVAGESCAACVSAADLAPACAPAASACSGASHGATPQETGSAARLARDFEDAHANAKELAQALQAAASKVRQGMDLSRHSLQQFVDYLASEAAANVARMGRGADVAPVDAEDGLQSAQHLGQCGLPEQ